MVNARIILIQCQAACVTCKIFKGVATNLKIRLDALDICRLAETTCIKLGNKKFYIIIRVHSAFSLVASCVLLKYTRTDDVN